MTLSAAHEALAATRQLLDLAAQRLKERGSVDGRLSGRVLDEFQLVSYDLALSAAEATAAEAMLDYAAAAREKAGAGDDAIIEERLALVFAAEAVQSIGGRFAQRPDDYGLSDDDLTTTVGAAKVTAWAREQVAVGVLAALGARVADMDGATGAYLLGEDAEMMRATFRDFANEKVMPLAEEIHRQDLIVPESIVGAMRELGCFGLSIPERYDGLCADDHEDNMGMIAVTEELSRGSLGAAGSLITRPEILSRALLAGGTEEQRRTWLPKLAAGEPLCGVAVTEPDFGSDVAGMKFRATPTDGGWLLSGTKSWATFGGKAGVLLVLARTDPDPEKGHKGLSLFLVEKPSLDGHDFQVTQDGGGSLNGRAIPTIGYRGMHSFELFFEDWFVPSEALLGGPEGAGKGFYYTMAGFAGGRIQTAARAVGVMQAAFEQAVRYAGDRKVFGEPIATFQLTRVKLARMAAHLLAARQFTYAVGRLMDEGGGQMEASMVKLFAGKTAEWLTREATQIHGGMGYAEETPVSRYFLDARVLSIFEGAEEVLALKVITRALLANAGRQENGE